MERLSDQYSDFINELKKRFKPYIKAVNKIKAAHKVPKGTQIDFSSLSSIEQRTLHVSWLLLQVYYQVLSTPILTASGEVSPEATDVLGNSREMLNEIHEAAFQRGDNSTLISNIVEEVKAKRMMVINCMLMIALSVLGYLNFKNRIAVSIGCFVGAILAGPISMLIRCKTKKQQFIIRIFLLVLSVIIAGVPYYLF